MPCFSAVNAVYLKTRAHTVFVEPGLVEKNRGTSYSANTTERARNSIERTNQRLIDNVGG